MNERADIYARQEPAKDGTRGKRDTVFYRDAQCSQFFARWPWHLSSRPTSRASVVLGCTRYRIEWRPNA